MTRGLACALVATVLLASACGGVPPTYYYLLEPRDVPAEVGARTSGPTIGVRAFRVDPPYDQDRLVYRIGEDSPRVGFYAYHRWAAPLARMLPAFVAAALEGLPGTRSVEPAVPGRDYDLWLDGHVLALEEVDRADGPRVRLHLRLDLVDRDGTRLWSETLDGDLPAPTDEVRVVVERMGDLLGGMLAGAGDGLAGRLRRPLLAPEN